jgi:hypothetical protein
MTDTSRSEQELPNSGSNKVVGFETAGDLVKRRHPELLVSKRKHRQAEAVQLVRLNREGANPNLGFASRPFVLWTTDQATGKGGIDA